MKYLREIFDDWLTRAAGIVFLLIVALVIFNMVSDLPEIYPLFGVFNRLSVKNGRVCWSELVPDIRWGKREYSIISVLDSCPPAPSFSSSSGMGPFCTIMKKKMPNAPAIVVLRSEV